MKMKSIFINVTKSDMKHGESKSCKNCPIARAAGRHINRGVSVGIDNLKVCGRKRVLWSTSLPSVAKEFISNFDSATDIFHERATPFQFRVDIPTRYLRAARKEAK